MSPIQEEHIPLANRPETVIGVVATFVAISAIAVSLRLFVRGRERLYGWDDFFVVLAAASCLAGSVFACLMPSHGLGKHFWTLDADTTRAYFKYVWVSNLTYCISTTCIKISILTQYLRLFKGRSDLARKATWAILIFTSCWGLSFGMLALLSCTPIAKNWEWDLPGKCVGWGSKNADEFFATWMAHASSNMCLDTLILALPVPFINNLRMSGKTRTGLITLFVMGGVTVSLSIARVIAISIRRLGTVPVFDPSWATPTVYIFSVLELNMAIITASIPIFWPLVASLAMNKILIVNEIEIRTERVDNSFALADQGKSFAGVGEDELPRDRASRLSVRTKSMDRPGRNNSLRLNRTKHTPTHSESSNKSGARSSHESQRKLHLTHQSSANSFSSFSKGSAKLEDSPDLTHARYQNKFTQEWAVPDFDAGAQKSGNAETVFTASVERAEIPYDHIRALEK